MQFFRKNLSNGMTVLHEKRELPVIAISITNRFGSSSESSDIKGIAHFIEHLVFTGTKTRTHEDISREIEKRGGVLNAFTNESITSFWVKLPSEHLSIGLDIISDILINPTFPIDKFEKEKRVVIEEIKMYHDVPQYHIYDKILENLYCPPFGDGIIGSEKTLSGLKRDFVMKYFKDNYNPSNYIVTVVGNADLNEICKYLEEKFVGPKIKLNKIPLIKKINIKSVEERAGLDQAHFIFGIHSPQAHKKESYAFEVLDAFLANGMSSKLFLTIREERGLAYSVKSTIDSKKDYGYYTIYVGTKKEAIPEVEKLILEGFDSIKDMTEKQLKESKERLVGLWEITREESTSVMNELMFAEITMKAENYYEYSKNIMAVTLDEVKALAKIKDYSTAAIVPK